MCDAPLTYHSNPGKQAGTTILSLVGPLTLANMFAFQTDLRALQVPVLILDLSGVTYMDSAGLGLLMNGYVSAQGRQHKFFLAAVNERVQSLLQLTKVDKVLKTFPSAEEAEAAA